MCRSNYLILIITLLFNVQCTISTITSEYLSQIIKRLPSALDGHENIKLPFPHIIKSDSSPLRNLNGVKKVKNEMVTIFAEYKREFCSTMSFHRLKKRAITTPFVSTDSTCSDLQGGTRRYRNVVNGVRMPALCKNFQSVLLWNPKDGHLFREKLDNIPRDQYTCEHMVTIMSLSL